METLNQSKENFVAKVKQELEHREKKQQEQCAEYREWISKLESMSGEEFAVLIAEKTNNSLFALHSLFSKEAENGIGETN